MQIDLSYKQNVVKSYKSAAEGVQGLAYFVDFP